MNKINSYIGFAKKSRKIVYGADKILACKTCKLILASEELAQNTLNKLQTKNVKIQILPAEEFQLLDLNGLVVAITDQSLANAIKNNISAQ